MDLILNDILSRNWLTSGDLLKAFRIINSLLYVILTHFRFWTTMF